MTGPVLLIYRWCLLLYEIGWVREGYSDEEMAFKTPKLMLLLYLSSSSPRMIPGKQELEFSSELVDNAIRYCCMASSFDSGTYVF